MAAKTINILEMDDAGRKAYMQLWWKGFETALIRKIRDKKDGKTTFTIQYDNPKESIYAVRRLVTLKNGNKTLKFSIEIFPWMFKDGSVFSWFQLQEASNLPIPVKKIKPMKKGVIWGATYDPIDFLTKTEPVLKYIQAVELTATDVGLFDNINAAIENFLGK